MNSAREDRSVHSAAIWGLFGDLRVGYRPYSRALNLLDIMEKFKIERVYDIGNRLNGAQGVAAQELMLYPDATAQLAGPAVTKYLDELAAYCDEVGCAITAIEAKRICNELNPETPLRELITRLGEVSRRFHDELSAHTFLRLESGESKAYDNNARFFGDVVLDTFPAAQFDISEATKCYAVARYTACVFHLMRVLEVGLATLTRLVEVDVHSPTWKGILDKLENAISATPEKSKTPDQRARDRKIKDFVYHIASVKDVVRNPIIHRVEVVYDKERASHVISAVAAFMQRLAEFDVADPSSNPDALSVDG